MGGRVDGKVAIVSGASRGIGGAIAAELLASGAKGVTITSRKEPNIGAAAERLNDVDRVMAVAARADSAEAAIEAVAQTVARFGR